MLLELLVVSIENICIHQPFALPMPPVKVKKIYQEESNIHFEFLFRKYLTSIIDSNENATKVTHLNSSYTIDRYS